MIESDESLQQKIQVNKDTNAVVNNEAREFNEIKQTKRKMPCITAKDRITDTQPKQKKRKTAKKEEIEDEEDLDETVKEDEAELKGQTNDDNYTNDPEATEEDVNWIVNDKEE